MTQWALELDLRSLSKEDNTKLQTDQTKNQPAQLNVGVKWFPKPIFLLNLKVHNT